MAKFAVKFDGERVVAAPRTPVVYRFSVFEADAESRELRRNGVRLRIQEQPFQVLVRLVERPGEIVTREELKAALWSADTFVDFDNGLNMAVKRLREVLGDDAERPKFIETIPRRGYRFIAEVEVQAEPGMEEVVEDLPLAADGPSEPRSGKRLGILVGLLVCGGIGTLALWWALGATMSVPRVVNTAQMTKDGLPKVNATFRLVSDGSRLYFQEGSLDLTEQNTALTEVAMAGGETARIPISLRSPIAYDFSAQRSELLLGAGEFELADNERPLWVLPLPAGPPHRVRDIVTHDACWSPDGQQLAFAKRNEVFVAAADGSNARKLATAEGFDAAWSIRFSPDGQRVRFSAIQFATPEHSQERLEVMEASADGSGLRTLPIHGGCCGIWTADGKNYLYQKGRDTWVLPERRSWFGGVRLGQATQLTSGPLAYGAPTPSPDGRQAFVLGQQRRVELSHYRSDTKQWEPLLKGVSAAEAEVSPDQQWVTYTTFPENELWRSRLDGSERLQLTFAPMDAHEPRWSPDGKEILFTDFPYKIFVVPANGGAPRQLMADVHPDSIGAGAWLPDGKAIIFSRHLGCGDGSCWAAFRMDLASGKVTKIPGSDGLLASRLSHDGHYLTALPRNAKRVMLYDLESQRWSVLAEAFGSVAWAHDSKSIYLHRKHENKPAELVRISVPDGRVQRVVELGGLTLGGLWPDWLSLLPDDSPVVMLDRSTEEIYRLELQDR